jgi:hypothetical protein
MNSRTTRRFRELLAALPAHVRRQARDAYALFRQNPSHPGLRFKKIHPDPPMYSARVVRFSEGSGAFFGQRLIAWDELPAEKMSQTPSCER